ncbi:Methyl-accepting chemotaxis protein McpQ [BD1-7 clade bacterium]|uniref:Methyl-accepting chemotaxis protein McpQ n=1 Tax=BD1-7 clade bacterium TaxID=2029982 RepID=A0A5S9QE95_9GAMM|nr:Methyl-accepting chemotaxis protein McpQ [BD1-7 clade bacterium]CAA0084212.1 Methyl-accepting chemotaxis protein McpQ [BD1-7 clade bacterium]CAA0115733.1 Methyl-accepting chemotaxis protein McpQ [BD1-7 clade bacterium]
MSTTSSTMLSKQSNKNIIVLGMLMALAFIFFVWNIVKVFQDAEYDSMYLETTGDLRVLAQQISTHSREAAEGRGPAFEELESDRQKFQKSFVELTNGRDGLPPLPDALGRERDSLGKVWNRVNSAASVIYANKARVLFLHEVASTLSASIPELQQKYDTVVDILIDSGASAEQIAEAQKQTWRAERIARNVDKMLAGGEQTAAAADQFNSDASNFGDTLNSMINGNAAMGIRRVSDEEARQALKEIAALFQFITTSVDDIFEASPDLKKVHEAADAILVDSPVMMTATSRLADRINNLEETRNFDTRTAIIAALVFLFFAAFIGVQLFLNTRTRLAETDATNERNQQAILRLLDELADLADGDLTTTATVTEDFTGAIADSINFTIDQLRILVSQINDTALRVSNAAEETQSTALHLAEASEHQAQEIAGASAAVNEMAVTIDQVSANAAESAQVAERSVKIANRGAEVVQNTINGMDTIREQIQDTAKRIKRLGESSQEIGDIVSLINDIADQTNILALNAAIQASMAGDAGRGFAVVADEVQRLAERSSAATKQIEALVKTIQSDTNEAVISMEQTTSEVVRGARLAQDAGMALEEIEKVSAELADLIQNISNAARQQAASAGHISNTMNVIQEITQQTNAGTTATARSIGNLAGMATELRGSVAGFTLPEEEVA